MTASAVKYRQALQGLLRVSEFSHGDKIKKPDFLYKEEVFNIKFLLGIDL